MSTKKSIRRTQAVKPFGPGAILDLGQESFVVLDTYRNRRAWDRPSQKIRLGRLEAVERAHDGFRLPPTIGGFGQSEVPALQVQRFPAWMFCPRCRRMTKTTPETEEAFNGKVPKCSYCRGSALVPMRFVAACTNGHLSDVDWWQWAHSSRKGSKGQCTRSSPKLLFKAQNDLGSSNKALAVECERCGARRTLEDITKGSLTALAGQRCSGRQPWQKRDDAEECPEEPRSLLRSQTAVHFDEVSSALDLQDSDPGEAEELNAWLRERLTDLLDLTSEITAEMKKKLAAKASQKFSREVETSVVDQVLASVTTPDLDGIVDASDPLQEEWPKLIVPTNTGARRAPLRVRHSDWRATADVTGLGDLLESVMLVERLREVRALTGFRRVEPDGKLVRPDLGRGQPWLPATEVFGEGIFIRFSNSALAEWEQSNKRKLQARLTSIRKTLKGENWIAERFSIKPDIAPRFILLHTFSHLLIRQLTYECGYSGAALRERLYAFPDRCGVLIYTADADSEGSLGGLVRQGKEDRFVDTVSAALSRSTWCSNDPICSEMPEHGLEKLNRAACHACSLVAETSCTHLNLLLDRKLVVGDGEHGPKGFFHSMIVGE